MSATNRGSQRVAQDFYATPLYSLAPILDVIDWQQIGSFCEPCKGDGRIVEAVRQRKYGIETSWFELSEGRDYLAPHEPLCCDLIVTNPPYSQAQEFIDRALRDSYNVAMLLRLNFLGAQCRYDWWRRRSPEHILVLSKRPSFDGGGQDACEYGWFCWGPAFQLRGAFNWALAKPEKRSASTRQTSASQS